MLIKSQIAKAIELIQKDEIVILPTDTIFGISALYKKSNETKINEIKKSNKSKQLIVLVSSISQLEKLGIKEEIILENKITYIVPTLKNKTLAIRMIAREDIKEIINQVGPIFSTSVNLNNEQAINTKKELNEFNKDIHVFFDNEPNNTQPSRIYNTITKSWVR